MKRASARHSPFILLIDENHAGTRPLLEMLCRLSICYKLPRECGLEHSRHDEPLLKVAGENAWVFLTCDKTIRRNHLEWAAALRYKVNQFTFSNNHMDGATLAMAFRRALPGLLEIYANASRPFIASIGKSGHVELLYDGNGRVKRQ